jgi:hypothetical protein
MTRPHGCPGRATMRRMARALWYAYLRHDGNCRSLGTAMRQQKKPAEAGGQERIGITNAADARTQGSRGNMRWQHEET